MKNIEIILTSKCNLKCVFCSSTYCEQVKEFNANTVKKILQWGRKANAEGIYFGGGEPTLVESLPILINFAKELNYKVIRLRTNGVLFRDKRYLKRLIATGLNELEISVHHCDPKACEDLTNVEGAFKSQLQGIKNTLASSITLELAVLVYKGNYKDLPHIISYYADFGVRNFTLWLVTLFGLNAESLACLVPEMPSVVPYLNESFSLGSTKRLNVRCLHFPVCFFEKKYRKYVHSAKDIGLLVVEPSGRFKLEDSPFVGGEKPFQCSHCRYKDTCLGMRKDYLDIYGDKEIRPIL